jgi:hypothetical protein
MTEDQIRAAISTAVTSLKRETPVLEFNRVHERSTAHRLAVQMEPLFAGWNVDCEYDRDGQTRKALEGIAQCDGERPTDWILPDIIVHHRREFGRDHNLLVIEIKKIDPENTCDRKKLELLTGPDGHYQYQLGLYINIDGDRFFATWYRDGEQSPPTAAL